jgi:hypothetical protein
MIVLVRVALLALVAFSVSFTAHRLLIVAAVLVGIWLVMFAMDRRTAAAAAPSAERG